MPPDAKFTSVEAQQVVARVLTESVFETAANTSIDLSSGNFILTPAHLKSKLIEVDVAHVTNNITFPSARTSSGLVQSLFYVDETRVGDSFFVCIANKTSNAIDLRVAGADESVSFYPSVSTFKINANTNRLCMIRVTDITVNSENYSIYLL